MFKIKLDTLRKQLEKTTDLLNKAKEKIFSGINDLIKIEEKSIECKELKKQYRLENIFGSLYKEKNSDFVLFSEDGSVIILLEKKETYIQSDNYELITFSKEKGWFGSKYLIHIDEGKSVYISKKSSEVLKSLLSEYKNYQFEKIKKLFIDKERLEDEIYNELKEVKIDGSDICINLYEKYKNKKFILDKATISKKIYTTTWKDDIWNFDLHVGIWKKINDYVFGLKSGVLFKSELYIPDRSKIKELQKQKRESLTEDSLSWLKIQEQTLKRISEINFFYSYFTNSIETWGDKFNCEIISINMSNLSLKKIEERVVQINNNSIVLNYYDKKYTIKTTEDEAVFLKELFDNLKDEIETRYRMREMKKFGKEHYKKEEEKREKERLKKLKSKTKSILDNFDKDQNGIIDFVEADDDFMKLFRKHQNFITKNNSDQILKFVQTSDFLKTKRKNIQLVFSKIKNVTSEDSLENSVKILKNEIHTYNSLLLHSINMLIALVKNDQITFFQIYVCFDKLNIFNSNWQNDISNNLNNISEKLTTLSSQLNSILLSIEKMNVTIVEEIKGLQYITSSSFKSLEKNVNGELASINSTMKFNNLLNAIQTYQMYKINKNTKSLK